MRWVASAALLLAFGCSRKVEEKEALIPHRVQPCTSWCEVHVGDCGRPVESWDGVDDCIEACATPEGNASFGWGYQNDGSDACEAEWKAMAACAVALTCEDQKAFFGSAYYSIPEGDRPCWPEFDAMSNCQIANPYEQARKGG
jgi:hypothetical protein